MDEPWFIRLFPVWWAFALLTSSGLFLTSVPPSLSSSFRLFFLNCHCEQCWDKSISLHKNKFLTCAVISIRIPKGRIDWPNGIYIFIKDFQVVLNKSCYNSHLESTLYYNGSDIYSTNFNVHLNYPEILLRCKLWFGRARLAWDSAFLTAPGWCWYADHTLTSEALKLFIYYSHACDVGRGLDRELNIFKECYTSGSALWSVLGNTGHVRCADR